MVRRLSRTLIYHKPDTQGDQVLVRQISQSSKPMAFTQSPLVLTNQPSPRRLRALIMAIYSLSTPQHAEPCSRLKASARLKSKKSKRPSKSVWCVTALHVSHSHNLILQLLTCSLLPPASSQHKSSCTRGRGLSVSLRAASSLIRYLEGE